MARIYEGEEDTPQAKLLVELQKLQRLQRRSSRIYDDDASIVSLDGTPIRGIDLSSSIPQRDLPTGKKYTPFIVIAKRESVIPQ